MRIPVKNIVQVELIKLIKRKDFLGVLAIMGIGILFAASILSNSYKGAEKQSALFWTTTQMLNSSILFISPMILAYSGIQTLAREMESGSIKLLDSRIRNRKSLYIGKSIALMIYSFLFFMVCILIHLVVYFTFVCQNEQYASGLLVGENTIILLSILLCVFFSSFILIPQIALFFGTFLKQGMCIGMIFMIVLVAHNMYKLPIVGELSPWHYITKLANDVMNTTKRIEMGRFFLLKNIFMQFGICGIYYSVCMYAGIHIMKKRDL